MSLGLGLSRYQGPQAASPNLIGQLALWLDASKNVVFGGMATPIALGSAPPAVTFTGVPTFGVTQSFEIDIQSATTFSWKHNGVTGGTGITIASTVLLTDGVTANFPAGTYVLGQGWTSVPVVSSWTSVVGSAFFSQATLAKMPYWIAPGLSLTGWAAGANSLATVRGDGASHSLTSSYAPSQPCSLYAVLTPRSGSAVAVPIGDTAGGGGNYLYFNPAPPAATTLVMVVGAAGSTTTLQTSGVFATAAMLFSTVLDGANSQMPISHLKSPQGSGNWTGMCLFSINGSADYYGGDVSELVVYSNHIAAVDAAGVEAYFSSKFGL